MGLCASSPTNESATSKNNTDNMPVRNPSHSSSAVARRKSFVRKDTVTNLPSRITPAQKPHNKKFPMITSSRIDNIDDYYTPCVLSKNKSRKPQITEASVSDPPKGSILGKGQFGTVVRCINVQHNYMCALKSVQKAATPTKYDDAKSRKKFDSTIETLQNEVKQLTKLTGHPAIVALYEVLETSTHLYFSTEVCKGQELFHAISEYGAFSEADAASVMKDILSAIDYMHSHNVMHRDLKPENILLTILAEKSSVSGRKGKAMCSVKIVDFGLASDKDRSSSQAGTPYYIAPEVLNASAKEKKTYGKECDIWSLGVICYIMLCGYPPFYGDSDLEIYERIRNGFENLEDRYPPEDWNDISDSAQVLIQDMLIFDPSKRPSASDCKKHEWITTQGPNIGRALHDAVVAKLLKFQNFNKFKQVAKRLIAETLDDRDIQHLKEAFNQYDTDGDGSISIMEMKTALAKGKGKMPHIDQKFLDALDIDGDGMIDYSEFLVATMRTKHWHTTDRLKQAFDILDRDNSGQLEIHEVRAALGGTDDNLANEIIEQFDVDGDGKISYEEFESMMLSDAREKLLDTNLI
jgi:calcium-dependent protein kinase